MACYGRRHPQDEGALRRPWGHGARPLACRIWKAHRGRNREVGEGHKVLGREGRLIATQRRHEQPKSCVVLLNQQTLASVPETPLVCRQRTKCSAAGRALFLFVE